MSNDKITRVVVADDHRIIRQGIRKMLSVAPDIEVIGEAQDGLEALRYVHELQPDILLLDIEMPHMDGLEVMRTLKAANLPVRILVMSAHTDKEYIQAILDSGVSGYLVKGDEPNKLIETVVGIARSTKDCGGKHSNSL